MKTNNKRNLIGGFLLSMLVGVPMTSCSDWTEMESIKLNEPGIESQNPELYAKYLENLKAYKDESHKVVIASFDNKITAPACRNEHLTDMPDSIDYICLNNIFEVNAMNAAEVAEVHKKGTKVVGLIDFDAIVARWKAILDEEANAPAPEEPAEGEEGDGEEGGEEVVVDPATRFIDFCKTETAMQLEACDALGLDGVVLNFTGLDLNNVVGDEAIAAETMRQGAFFDLVSEWKAACGKTVIFKGCPQNVISKEILADCKFIIINAHSAKNYDEMSYLVMMAYMKDIPADRYVMGVSTPYVNAAGIATGTLGDGTLTSIGAARWTLLPASGYVKAGISIDAVQQDYFNVTFVYPNVREAINIMNPTVK